MRLNIIIFFIIGTIFGSLGSVLLVRLSEKVTKDTIKGILRGRSQCTKCSATLKARNLIPILSFFRQGGKCEHCKQKISYLYPVLELLSGLVFVISRIAFKNIGTTTVMFRCIINRLLLLLIVYDVLEYELHVPIRMIFVAVAFVPQFFGGRGNYVWALIGGALFSIFFFLIYLFAKRYVKKRHHEHMEGFGEGDIYMGGAIGLLIPFALKYSYLNISLLHVLHSFLLFIILSCLFGILFRIAATGWKKIFPTAFTNTISPIFQHKILIPFIPAMIVAFRILLGRSAYFIGLFFPGG